MNPTETTIEVEIGGTRHTLYFNLNAFRKFEEESSLDDDGKRLKFPKFLFRLLDAWSNLRRRVGDNPQATDPAQDGSDNPQAVDPAQSGNQQALLDAIGEIGAADIHALLYGALHVYDRDDRPSWPISPGRLGRILGPMELMRLLPQIMTGLQANLPRASDNDKKGGEGSDRPIPIRPASTPTSGGSISGELDEEPLGLLTMTSEG